MSSSEQQSQHNKNNIRTSQAQIWVVHDKETGQLMTNKPTSSPPSSKWSWPPVATTSPTTHKPTPHFFIYYPIGPQPTTPPPSPPPTTRSPSSSPSTILPSKSPTSLPSKSPITPLPSPSSSSPSNSPISSSSSSQPTTERPRTFRPTTSTTTNPSKSPSYKPIYIPSPTPPPSPSLTPPLTTSPPTIPPPINNKVTGHLFYDANSNGSFDSSNSTGDDDVHISNINIWLFTCGGGRNNFSDIIVSNTKTSSEGTFVFDELRVGTYLVVVQLPKGYESSTILPFMEDPIPWYTDVIDEQIKSKIREEEEESEGSSSSSMQGSYHTDKQQQDDGEGRSHTSDNIKQQTTSSSSSEAATICRSICFNIQEGQSNHIDLSFGMQLVPTLRPSHIPSAGPTNIMPTFMPTIKETYSKSEVEPSTSTPTSYPTISIHPSISSTPTHEQSLYWNIGPITTSNLRITLFGIDTIHNAVEWNEIMALYIEDYFNDHDDDDSDGSNGKNLSHATVWDVDTSVILTGQSSKVIHNDDLEGDHNNNNEITKEQRNSDNDRRLKGHIAVEIIYNQVTSYKTSNPEDIDVSYLLQEPFSTTINRYEFISYLQTLSLDYDDVTSVSGVRLPPYMTGESTVITTPSNDTFVAEKESMKDVGVKYALPVFFAGIILILVVQFARRKLIVIGAADGSVSSMSSDEKDKTGSGSRHSSSGKLRDSGSSKKSDGLLHFGGENISDEEEADEPHSSIPPPHTWQVGTHLDRSTHGSDIEVQDIYPESLLGKTPSKKRISPPIEPPFPTTTRDTSPRTFADSTFNLSEIIIDIVIPPGRVGCIIDSSPKKGPYICEVDNTSPIRNEIQVCDRIIAVDEVDVSRMNAINVSKLLGKRSQNEERVLTILRECVYEYISPESPEIHVNVIQQRSSVSPLASSGVNTSSEGEMNFTSSSSEELTGGNNSAMDPPGWKKTQHSMSL